MGTILSFLKKKKVKLTPRENLHNNIKIILDSIGLVINSLKVLKRLSDSLNEIENKLELAKEKRIEYIQKFPQNTRIIGEGINKLNSEVKNYETTKENLTFQINLDLKELNRLLYIDVIEIVLEIILKEAYYFEYDSGLSTLFNVLEENKRDILKFKKIFEDRRIKLIISNMEEFLLTLENMKNNLELLKDYIIDEKVKYDAEIIKLKKTG